MYAAVHARHVVLDKVSGLSFGKNALSLTLSVSRKMSVVLLKGTIFQHTDWLHKQNLMISQTVCLALEPSAPYDLSSGGASPPASARAMAAATASAASFSVSK